MIKFTATDVIDGVALVMITAALLTPSRDARIMCDTMRREANRLKDLANTRELLRGKIDEDEYRRRMMELLKP